MNKNIIKLAIAIVVTILVYSVFWFFKVGQVEKKINNFISENNLNISAGEVAVSGFPLSQKIAIKDLKFSIPNSPLSKYHIIVKNAEAMTGIFSNDFSVNIAMDAVLLQDADEKNFTVEFASQPQINFALDGEGFVKISYQDLGHKILDEQKNTIYSASSSSVSFEAVVGEDGKMVNKVNADVKEIVGFDAIDLYKSSLEKRIMDGIKTGEIAVNDQVANPATGLIDPSSQVSSSASIPSSVAAPTAPVVNANIAAGVAANPVTPNAAANVVSPAQNQVPSEDAKNDPAANAANPVVAKIIANPSYASDPAAVAKLASEAALASVAASLSNPDQIPSAPVELSKNIEPVKSNLLLNLEYFITASADSAAQNSPVSLDPTKIEESVVIPSNGKTIKINNLEFSNNLYKLYINGELNSMQDDSMLSGSVSVKVEKIDIFVASLLEGFGKILDSKKNDQNAIKVPSDLSLDPTAAAPVLEKKVDSYQVFLTKVLTNLNSVSKEMAAKNPVSKGDVAVFDIRREKNLEFLINETSIREVLGKF